MNEQKKTKNFYFGLKTSVRRIKEIFIRNETPIQTIRNKTNC